MTLKLDAQGFPERNGQMLDLPPKERAVLSLLIRRWPQVVSKQDFADGVWHGGEMSDESLARCISRIRAALSDAPGARIESVYGAGYRLDAGAAHQASHARLTMATHAPPQAVEAFLHARLLAHQRTPAAMARALALLRQLIAQHPRYVPARIAFAEAVGGAAGWAIHAQPDLIDEGLRELDEAEGLDPASVGIAPARAHLLDCAWRYGEARAAWTVALPRVRTDPDSLFLYGRFLLVTGDTAGAVEHLCTASHLHPHSALFRVTLARALAHAGDAAAALVEAQAACDEHPTSAIAATYRLALHAWAQPDAAVAQALRVDAEQRDAPPMAQPTFAYALARCGQTREASQVLEAALARPDMPPCVAVLYVATLVALGDHARAMALFTAAEAARCGVLPMTLRDPPNAALRGMPEHDAKLRRVFGS